MTSLKQSLKSKIIRLHLLEKKNNNSNCLVCKKILIYVFVKKYLGSFEDILFIQKLTGDLIVLWVSYF